jgi:hypothetical protein
MTDMLINLFLHGIDMSENPVDSWLKGTSWMLLICLIIVYLIMVCLLAFSKFYRSTGTRPLIDTDARVKLCASWALLVVSAMMTVLLGVIWRYGFVNGGLDVLAVLRTLSCHFSTVVALWLIWGAVYLGIRADVRQAQGALSIS